MSILTDLNTALAELDIAIETGVFSDEAPEEYLVITPLNDIFLFADNKPYHEIQQARLSLFSKGNYMSAKKRVVNTLLNADFTISDRFYIGHEDNTGYHHYAIDVEKEYIPQKEDS